MVWQIVAGFIYFATNTDIAVNYVLINSIVVNSILTAFDFGDVPNSDIHFGIDVISDFHKISAFPLTHQHSLSVPLLPTIPLLFDQMRGKGVLTNFYWYASKEAIPFQALF